MHRWNSIENVTGRVLILVVLTGLFSAAGCGKEANGPLQLTSDQIEVRERKAVEQLKELGCKVAEVDDQLIGTPGILVTLFKEHLTTTGKIRTDVMSQFRYLQNLFLVTDATRISADGLAELRNLDNLLLVSAQWTSTNDKGLASIEGIVSLKLLRLNWSMVTDDGLKHIERLPELAMLYLTGTAVTDEVVPHIRPLKSLKALQLSHTGISDVGLAGLKGFAELTHLGLDGTIVTDDSIPVITGFTSLKYLNVSDTDMTDAGMRKLKDALPDCRVESEPKPKPPLPTYKYPGIKPFATAEGADAKAAAAEIAKVSPGKVKRQSTAAATSE